MTSVPKLLKPVEKGSDPLLALAVLISGRGSNLQAILDAIADGRVRARVSVVVSNRAEAPGLYAQESPPAVGEGPRAPPPAAVRGAHDALPVLDL